MGFFLHMKDILARNRENHSDYDRETSRRRGVDECCSLCNETNIEA